jgi:hypothetical protein
VKQRAPNNARATHSLYTTYPQCPERQSNSISTNRGKIKNDKKHRLIFSCCRAIRSCLASHERWGAADRGEHREVARAFAKDREARGRGGLGNLLNEAIHPCRDRNFLAHGTWCCFNRRTLTVELRGGVRWGQPELPPENRAYTVSDILKLARKFRDIEAELYKIRRSLEPKMSEAEMARSI